jgi:DNA-binding response OmpR family regulator
MAGKKRILYIEDKIEMIGLTRIFLKQSGFEVRGAIGGVAGLEAIRREKPDLVLLDLVMPGMSGWEVFERMQADEALADIPVIVITARPQTMAEVLGPQARKVADYITKPFVPRELVNRINRVLSEAAGQK